VLVGVMFILEAGVDLAEIDFAAWLDTKLVAVIHGD
jgi:hypothetical protein